MSTIKELWRLRINGLLTQILTAILYSISDAAYLTSCHRFVTNPTKEGLLVYATNETDIRKIEPGLGESELFYSFVVTALNVTSVIGGLLSGFLVRYVPHWYQYLLFISLHTIGYLFYAVAFKGWILLLGMLLAGFFMGAEFTLGFNYANEISVEYVELLKRRGEVIESSEKKAVRIRNYLYSAHSVGYSAGYAVGTGVAVLFANLPIEQYHSIAWFNVACGLALLVLFIFCFRGEAKWKKVKCNFCCRLCVCNRSTEKSKYSSLKLFIVISMLVLSFVEMLKWAYFDVLLNPVLSDSFGLSLSVSSYFYLGLAVPRIAGALLLVLLQRIRISTQMLAIAGLVMAVIGYLLVADWQAIPYDVCTENSPFHHPQLYQNQSLFDEQHPHTAVQPISFSLGLSSNVKLKLHNLDLVMPVESSTYKCHHDSACPSCKTSIDSSVVCLTVMRDYSGRIVLNQQPTLHERNEFKKQVLLCSLNSQIQNFGPKICVNFYDHISEDMKSNINASVQSLMVLPDSVYELASSNCMNASNKQCHWIPFSTVTNTKCIDCPPICRSKQQTLTFPQFIIGLSLLIASDPILLVATLALAANQTPKESQALVIGGISSINAVGQSVGPVLVDALYEDTQKRTFLSSILLACLHLPFLLEVVLVYKHLGPMTTKQEYTYITGDCTSDEN